MAKKETYYRIDFKDSADPDDQEYTLCRDWEEVMNYVSQGETRLPDIEGAAISITLVKMTEIQYGKFVEHYLERNS